MVSIDRNINFNNMFFEAIKIQESLSEQASWRRPYWLNNIFFWFVCEINIPVVFSFFFLPFIPKVYLTNVKVHDYTSAFSLSSAEIVNILGDFSSF